jgi:hypothetical protein
MTNTTTIASIVTIFGLAITYILLPEEGSVAIYRTAAIGAASAIGFSMFLEATNVRSLVRTDIIMIVALFGLTLVEFFFPQEVVNESISAESAKRGVEAVFLGFCGLVIGRHLVPRPRRRGGQTALVTVQWSAATLFRVYVLVFLVGYLNMLWAVGFNPIELVNQMIAPRFSQSWARGKYGGWPELLGEICRLMLYLVPALTGAILAKPYRFTGVQKTAALFGLAFTLFYAFASGTRNIFCIYLIIFFVTYILLRPSISWKRVTVLACIGGGLVAFASYMMLQFRRVGLDRFIESGAYGDAHAGARSETLFIDNNLLTISRLMEVFPDRVNYLGWEFASYAITRPVPRALWPSKTEELSFGIEDALGVGDLGYSLSSTFVGEAYMMGGYNAVIVAGLLFGFLAAWWNRLGLDLRSNVSVILYATGFFAAAISMRSSAFATTAMLPVVAMFFIARWYSPKKQPRVLQPMRNTPRM